VNVVAVTIGTFDLFHAGHVELLEYAAALGGGSVAVGLNVDGFVEEFKGRRPVLPYAERVRVLLAVKGVGLVLSNAARDARPCLLDLRGEAGAKTAHAVVVIGSDWHGRDYLGQLGVTWEWLHQNNMSICYVPRVGDNPSTTKIRERLGR
jgi:glycerol-3-phosphate cytidylyltransferase